jgi:hypothetical protein
MLKILMAIEHGPKHSLDVLTHQRTELLTLLQLRRRRPNKPARDGESELAQRLLADALVVRAEADLR